MNDAEKQKILIRCDKCEAQFDVSRIEPVFTDVNDILVHHWRCPECGQIYIIRLIDDEQRELDKKMIDCRAKLTKLATRNGKKAQRKALLEQFQLLKEASKKHQEALKNKSAKAVTDQLNKSEE